MALSKNLDVSLLIVEDDKHTREMLAEIVEAKAWKLYVAENGSEGLELFNRNRPDVVVTDVQMPVMNGLDMARAIRITDPDTQIIVISAYADRKYLLDSIEINVSHYMIKPFNIETIASLFERCVDFVLLKRTINEQHKQLQQSEARHRQELEGMVAERTAALQRLNLQYQHEIEERKRAQGELEAALEQLNHSQKELRNLTTHLEAIREEERKSMAREIHDELGQSFTGLTMGLRELFAITSYIDDDEKRKRFLNAIETTITIAQAGVRSMRRIISDLRPAILDDLGLGAAIEWLMNDFQNKSGIQCTLEGTIDHVDIDERRSIALFRILQESLANILRHAQATEVELRVWEDSETILMEVKDNGRGIGAGDLEKKRSFGILGMRERALSFGGTVCVTGEQEIGTTVRVALPKSDTVAEGRSYFLA